MCNPRRITVQITEAIQEAWRRSIEETATAEREVVESIRLTADIPLGNEMGEHALEVLEQLIAGKFNDYAGWELADDGTYRRELSDITLIFTPGSHQLLVETSLTETVSVEAQAEVEATGMTVGEIAFEAIQSYYDDGWGGRTKEWAEEQMDQKTVAELENRKQVLGDEQNAEKLESAKVEAKEQSQLKADRNLELEVVDTRERLKNELIDRLRNAQEEVNLTINRLVGETYRRSLIEAAQVNGGRVISDQRSGSVINLTVEFE